MSKQSVLEVSLGRCGRFLVIGVSLLLAIALANACRASAKRVAPNYPQIQSSSFPGVDTARLVTRDGDLWRTEDGGKTWQQTREQKLGKLDHLAFIDDQRGWANTTTGQVLNTTDGGRSWVIISSLHDETGGGTGQIGFLDQSHGWIIRPSALWHTDDGGKTWQRAIPPPQPTAYFCQFVRPKIAWLSGSNGTLVRFEDGAESWKLQTVGVEGEDLSDISFLDADTGWTFSPTHSRIHWTLDGGKTWKTTAPFENAVGLVSVSFLNRKEGWALAFLRGTDKSGQQTRTVLLHTDDGGQRWTERGFWADEPNMNRVDFVDPDHGWLLGYSKVYRTDDGGLTWRVVLDLQRT